ncbi:hypothetical protein [Singulisphaera acidiphila]|uniref:DUF3352 domain-containing protein n=1 Tax=Singulisphaera acidiphila (strain ATCC BAA-1392 / DSM 18658 / VKM B-2454 / MOB10) TaxID=886293 RepID=L0DDU6_SINAD|nr:hypothetical protein [Singulisphaera acidiphila]AGA27003.1 hypothetical protein Sinac_2705 [Singulisphaera acidiphila DSM 18658]
MRRLGVGRWILSMGMVGVCLGAAPAAPSYYAVEQKIETIREVWTKPGAVAQPNAQGWNAFFDALVNELKSYAVLPSENDRLAALNNVYQISVALKGTAWPPAAELREELRAWLRPRVRLAWAERRLVDRVKGLPQIPDPGVQENRERWVKFVGIDLGDALRQYEKALTVSQRQLSLKHLYAALNSLQANNKARPWVPSVELQAALDDLYNVPNLDLSADASTVAPALSADVVESGPIYRKGYVSQVTAGPKTGFGLLASDEGIAFYNSQLATSVTPITDFQNQLQQDRKGRQAAKLYYFTATSVDNSQITVTAVLTPNGLRLGPEYQHNVSAMFSSFKQQGKGLGRFFASLLGFNQAKIQQQVAQGAIGRIAENVVREAAELGGERIAQTEAQKNAQLAQYLLFGRNAASLRNLLITGLTLRSRPENVVLGGRLQWLNAIDQVGGDAPQPAKFAVPASGVSADLHLGSILTSLIRGYLQSEPARSVNNLMVITKKPVPDAPPAKGVEVKPNSDFASYLKAVNDARAVADPNVMAIRVKKPTTPPDFAADARGYLVALVHDFQIEVPVPPEMTRGGLFGPPAQVYRITSPQAEFVISFKVTPQTETSPVRLAGKIEGFDPGPGARIFTINDDEDKATALSPLASVAVMSGVRNKLQGRPIDLPLSNLQLQGFAIQEVTPLEPSGWIRVNLVRTSASPAAGVR